MSRSLTLAFLALYLYAALVPCIAADAPHANAAPPMVIHTISLKNVQCQTALDRLKGELKDKVPVGIKQMIGLIGLTLTDIPCESTGAWTIRIHDGESMVHGYSFIVDKAHPENTQQLMLLLTPHLVPAPATAQTIAQ